MRSFPETDIDPKYLSFTTNFKENLLHIAIYSVMQMPGLLSCSKKAYAIYQISIVYMCDSNLRLLIKN